MKYLFLISISCFILCSCNKESVTTPYQFANMTIEEIDDVSDDFYGQITLKHDTISFILEDDILVIDSLKFEECEAFHQTDMYPEVYVGLRINNFFPSGEYDDLSGVKRNRYRVSFDLIGICPKKFNAGVYFNGQTHYFHYPN